MPIPITIGYFITPHGFGHATRSAAVMEALLRRRSGIRFELFTTSPKQFFENSIGDRFGYHPIQSDIGVIQTSPLEEDLIATCDQLDRLLPFDNEWVHDLATQIIRLKCRLVICDIAPVGIEVARAAGIPSVLIENFTWDWIYENYSAGAKRLGPHITYLADLFQRANHHIQTPPLCKPSEKAFLAAPISRHARSSRSQIRKRLQIPQGDKMVLLTMGGVPDPFAFLSTLPLNFDWYLVIAGAKGMQSPHEKVILLPTHSSFLHPDLMVAADALVGKAGYSTVAEAYQSGIPFGYIRRPRSPESIVLEAFIQQHLPSMAIPPEAYAGGSWIERVPELLKITRGLPKSENGADAVARHLCTLL